MSTNKANGVLADLGGSRSVSPATDVSDGPTADSFLKRTAFPPAAEKERASSPLRLHSTVNSIANSLRGGGGGGGGGGKGADHRSGADEKGTGVDGSYADRQHGAAVGTTSRSNGYRSNDTKGDYDFDECEVYSGRPADRSQQAARTLLLSSQYVDPADYDGLRSRRGDRVAAELESSRRHTDGGDRTGGDDERGNRRRDERPLSLLSSSKSESASGAESAGRDSGRSGQRNRGSTPPAAANEKEDMDDNAASAAAAATAVDGVELPSPSVRRFFSGFGVLSSPAGVLRWASRATSGKLSRQSSTGSAGASSANSGEGGGGNKVGKSDKGSGGRSGSRSREKQGTSRVAGSSAGEVGETGVDAARRDERQRGQQHSTGRRESDRAWHHSTRESTGGHHKSGSEEHAGTWESDLKLALSMDLVNNGEGARAAKSFARPDGTATDAMDGGSGSPGSNKRKPDASPACTPDGPSPTRGGQHPQKDLGYAGAHATSMDEDSVGVGAATAATRRSPAADNHGERPGESSYANDGGHRGNEKAGTGAQSSSGVSTTHRRIAAAEHPGPEVADARCSSPATRRADSSNSHFAASERWRLLRRSEPGIGAGSRRGQPHPRGEGYRGREEEEGNNEADGDHHRRGVEQQIESDTMALLANPWLRQSATAVSSAAGAAVAAPGVDARTTATSARDTGSTSTRSQNGTRNRDKEGDVHDSTRRDALDDDEQSYGSVAGPEFESAWADTDFGSSSSGAPIRSESDRRIEDGGVGHRSVVASSSGRGIGNHSSAAGLRVAEVVLNDRLLGRTGTGAARVEGSSRDLSRGTRGAVTSRYPYATQAAQGRMRNGGKEFDDPHYKTLMQLRRDQAARAKILAGKGRPAGGGGLLASDESDRTSSCKSDSVRSEGITRHHDVNTDEDDRLPSPPSRQRQQQHLLPLQERWARASSAAPLPGNETGTPTATSTTTAAMAAARPPSPPLCSSDRSASPEDHISRWATSTSTRRSTGARSGGADSAAAEPERTLSRSDLSAFDVYPTRDYDKLEADRRRLALNRRSYNGGATAGTRSYGSGYSYMHDDFNGGVHAGREREDFMDWEEGRYGGGPETTSQKYLSLIHI